MDTTTPTISADSPLFKVPTEKLITFMVFVEQGSMAQAAKILKSSQPSVSRQLKELSACFSQPILSDDFKSRKLSKFGRELLDVAKANFSKLQNDLGHLLISQEDISGMTLHLGANRDVLARLGHDIPSFAGNLSLKILNSTEILEGLKNQVLDLAISRVSYEGLNYSRKIAFSDQKCLVFPKGFQSHSKKWEEMLSALMKSPLRQICYQPEEAQSSKRFTQIADWRVIIEQLQSGKFWGIVPSSYAPNWQKQCKSLRNPQKEASETFYLYLSKSLLKQNWYREYSKALETLLQKTFQDV